MPYRNLRPFSVPAAQAWPYAYVALSKTAPLREANGLVLWLLKYGMGHSDKKHAAAIRIRGDYYRGTLFE